MSLLSDNRSLSPWSPQFRHVVFPNALLARQRLPRPCGEESIAAVEANDLSVDEEAFLRWLFAEAGLDLRNYRLRTLKRRIPSCLRALRAHNFAAARRAIERKPSFLHSAISTMVIGVTSFFRDPQVFSLLRESVIPDLLKNRGGLSVWSIGCSDGLEVYSLAILLAEMGVLHRCTILGTDCRADAIRRAKAGHYLEAELRGIPAEPLARYFHLNESGWRISPAIEQYISWRKADVLTLHEPGGWDMILCRNVTMYFAPEATLGLWPRLQASLRTGGIMVLGKAERPQGVKHLSLVAPCIYRKTRG